MPAPLYPQTACKVSRRCNPTCNGSSTRFGASTRAISRGGGGVRAVSVGKRSTQGRACSHARHLPDRARPEAALALIDASMRDPIAEIGILIWPLLPCRADSTRTSWPRCARQTKRARRAGSSALALADFHRMRPRTSLIGAARTVSAARTRPMIQIVRTDVLAARAPATSHTARATSTPERLAKLSLGELSKPEPSLAARVAQQNLRTAQRVGIETIARVSTACSRTAPAATPTVEWRLPLMPHLGYTKRCCWQQR